MSYPRPVNQPSRNQNLRSGIAYLFPDLGPTCGNSGYNPRDVDGNPWTEANGWKGTPSRHAYTAAWDAMLNGPVRHHDSGQPYTYLEAVALGDRIANWAVQVATSPVYANADAVYGRIIEVIWNRRIWTLARQNEGWRRYSGASEHLEHVHMSLWCAEMDR